MPEDRWDHMRARVWSVAIPAAAILGCFYVSLWGSLWISGGIFPAGDYPGPACNGCDSAGPPIAALVHGHVTRFFSTQPFMGSVSLLLRAPFVALVNLFNGDFVAQYRVGTLVCLLVGVLVVLPAFNLMLRRGQHPLIVLSIIAAIVIGPATFRTISWGHPEEILGAGLAVGAMLAAIYHRGLLAGVLLGLAVATKQWGLFAVLPTIMLARGQRRHVAFAASLVAAAFVIPMLAADPARFVDQNFHTAVAQLGVTPSSLWWVFNHPGFDPSIHQELPVIATPLREVSHPLTVALVLGLSVVYWRRAGDRHPYDAFQLLALLFLIRCVLDPLTISYHHAPFVLAIGVFEGLRRRGIPVITLTSTAAILLLAHYIAPLGEPNLMNAMYLAWALPTIGYLTASTFGSRTARATLASWLDQPVGLRPALAH